MLSEVNNFIDYCKEDDKFTNNSIETYMSVLYKVAAFLGTDTDVKTIRKHHLQAYIDSLPDSLAQTTINHHIYIIRAFFKFLLEFDFVEGDVSSVLRTKGKKQVDVDILDDETFQRICRFNLKTILDYRDLAILHLMYNTGAAPGEICNLKHEDYNSATREITYSRDTGVRTILIDPVTAGILDLYIEKKKILPSGIYIFESRLNNPIQNRTLFNLIKKRVNDAGIKKPVSSMMFRYSYADRKFKEGLDIREIQRLLGHSHPYLTQRFMFLISESKKD